MADFNFPLTGQDTTGGLNNEIVKKEVLVDFATNNVDATETVEVMKIEAGQYILDLVVDVITAEGATATIDVGDGSSATRFFDDQDINAVAVTESATRWYKYAAADTIDILVNNDLDAAVIRVVATLCKSEA